MSSFFTFSLTDSTHFQSHPGQQLPRTIFSEAVSRIRDAVRFFCDIPYSILGSIRPGMPQEQLGPSIYPLTSSDCSSEGGVCVCDAQVHMYWMSVQMGS